MQRILSPVLFVAGVTFSLSAVAQEGGLARPDLRLRQSVEGMPSAARQEVSVLTATFQPGDRTVTHTHRFPVTVFVQEGAFTLEMDGREPLTIKAGEAFVEPHGVRMTGFNRSDRDPARVVIFYVGDPDTPFLELAH